MLAGLRGGPNPNPNPNRWQDFEEDLDAAAHIRRLPPFLEVSPNPSPRLAFNNPNPSSLSFNNPSSWQALPGYSPWCSALKSAKKNTAKKSAKKNPYSTYPTQHITRNISHTGFFFADFRVGKWWQVGGNDGKRRTQSKRGSHGRWGSAGKWESGPKTTGNGGQWGLRPYTPATARSFSSFVEASPPRPHRCAEPL